MQKLNNWAHNWLPSISNQSNCLKKSQDIKCSNQPKVRHLWCMVHPQLAMTKTLWPWPSTTLFDLLIVVCNVFPWQDVSLLCYILLIVILFCLRPVVLSQDKFVWKDSKTGDPRCLNASQWLIIELKLYCWVNGQNLTERLPWRTQK